MSSLDRFLGGPPLWVLARLVLLSILVGIVLAWFDLTPVALIEHLGELTRRLWNQGFDLIRDAFGYFLIGAAVVVPLFIVIRLIDGLRR